MLPIIHKCEYTMLREITEAAECAVWLRRARGPGSLRIVGQTRGACMEPGLAAGDVVQPILCCGFGPCLDVNRPELSRPSKAS